jgi:F-type H+-transporting ATPase subunit epsilon
MARETFHCSVITPEAKAYDGDADFVVIPAHDGEMGILRDRAPLVCQLGAGRLVVRQGNEELTWFIEGGFAQVLDNNVVVLTQKAIKPDQIERAEAERQLQEALHMSATEDVSLRRRTRAQASARARLRMARH